MLPERAYPIPESQPRRHLTLVYSASGDSERRTLKKQDPHLGLKTVRNDRAKLKNTVLIIEDQENFRIIFRDALEHAGYAVLEAADGQEGLDMIKKQKPDLVLLDLMLPKLHGFKVLEIIRSDDATKRIRVFILSVLDDKNSQEKGKHLGADAFLVKSHLSVQRVLSMIESSLQDNNG